jgi:hypothetical protein
MLRKPLLSANSLTHYPNSIRINSDKIEFISGFWGGWARLWKATSARASRGESRQGEEKIGLLKKELKSDEEKERSTIHTDGLDSAEIFSRKIRRRQHPVAHHRTPLLSER